MIDCDCEWDCDGGGSMWPVAYARKVLTALTAVEKELIAALAKEAVSCVWKRSNRRAFEDAGLLDVGFFEIVKAMAMAIWMANRFRNSILR